MKKEGISLQINLYMCWCTTAGFEGRKGLTEQVLPADIMYFVEGR